MKPPLALHSCMEEGFADDRGEPVNEAPKSQTVRTAAALGFRSLALLGPMSVMSREVAALPFCETQEPGRGEVT